MPCQGCNPGIALHTGTFIKHWCESDQSYHFDWEPCAPVQQPQPPVYNPPSSGGTPDPNADPVAMLPVLANGGATGGCGCCSGAKSPVPSPLTTSVATATGTTTTVAKKCNCGYTNREAFWAVVAALVFFILIRE